MTNISPRLRPLPLVLTTVALIGLASVASSQSRRSRDRDDKPNPRVLEGRAQKAEEALVNEYADIANGFYNIGDLEKARTYLERILKLRKDVPGVKDRIKQLDEEILSSNASGIEIDTSKGWQLVGQVAKGETFRIIAAGDYKMNASLTIDVNGLPTQDPVRDIAGNVGFGALMGMVVPVKGKPGRPFAVRAGGEQTPGETGQLYLRVNTPAGAKCTGRIKVQLSGKVVTARQR